MKWTDDDLYTLKTLWHLGPAVIAEVLGRSYSSVYNKMGRVDYERIHDR